ncbi:DPP IV N-terminal domain-containing protein [Thalassotalea sp. ND16A]|uniref:S9 family peptidase n=1 Tax=Thalassotalea sp. ND16A TaxID=1535422 RepID=UPI00051CEE71|nr:Dipeptidyl-peptidase IV [Thalassotalea sp. ND16A]
MLKTLKKSNSLKTLSILFSSMLLTVSVSTVAQVPFEGDAMITPTEPEKIEQAEALTIERIFSAPSLDGPTSKNLKYSPDGTTVTYLKAKESDNDRFDLWQYDIASSTHLLLVDSDSIFAGKEELSDEEKARRERQRVYGSGIMEYVLSSDGNNILFPINGDLYLYAQDSKTSRRLTEDQAYETDIKFSPKGRYVSFIKAQNIYIIDLQENEQKQLTDDGKGTIKNGMAEFVAQEEMDRMTGYWWSPNEKNIAFLKVDESGVQTVIRNEIYAEEVKLFEQRYPATGTNNVAVSLHNIKLSSGKTTDLNLGKEKDIYIARVNWLPDSKTIAYQWQDRAQQTLKLNFHTLKARKAKTIIEETSDHWVNLNDDLTFLKKSKQFIWASERDGYKHLYLYNYQGELISQLTKGQWIVDELVSIDEDNGWLYFTGRADTPIEKHLYKVTLDGKSPEHVNRVSKRSGFHNIAFANDHLSYLDDFSNINTPAQLSLHQANGKRLTYLLENKLDHSHPVAPFQGSLVTPTFGTLKASDGTTDLYYKLYTPQDLKPGKKYPVIVSVYGGPHAQRVTNEWTGADMTQYMVNNGYVVFQLDNRGSNYRGTAFEFAIYKELGNVELDDQISGVKYLQTLPYVDKENIGIFGHSYGGYMALMAMFKAGDYFSAGVSGAPVTDWMLYDTHYTERYLSHPATNADGYENSSVFPYAKDFDNDNALYIYHGMADDNVLFTNTTKLIKTLQDENKRFELMTYPGSKHSMRGKKVKVHLNYSIIDFFDRKLRK